MDNHQLRPAEETRRRSVGASLGGLVFNEAHYLKNHRSQRSRYATRIVDGNSTPVVHVLTGTPLTNRPRDLFPLLQLVQHSLGRSFLALAKRYCDGHKNEYGHWQTGGASNVDELSLQLQGIMLRRRKDQVLDLPPKHRTWIEVDVPAGIKAELDGVVGEYLDDTRRNRRGDRNIGRFSRARRKIAVAKVPQTIDFVTGAVDQGEKVVLYSHSRHAIRKLETKFGDEAVCITGDVPAKRRMALVDRFQHDDATRIFIGQIHAAGVGINLTAATLVVFNDLDWVPANHWQAEDRAHRIGQAGTVQVVYMVARQTLEELVRSILERKAMLIDDIVEGRAISEDMEDDVLAELRRMLAQLNEEFGAMSGPKPDRESVEELVRAATDRYLAENARLSSAAAKRRFRPLSDETVRSLAAVLSGSGRTVYAIESSSGGASYRVEVDGTDVVCDCKGFQYRGMCRHARDLKQAIATGGEIPPEFRQAE